MNAKVDQFDQVQRNCVSFFFLLPFLCIKRFSFIKGFLKSVTSAEQTFLIFPIDQVWKDFGFNSFAVRKSPFLVGRMNDVLSTTKVFSLTRKSPMKEESDFWGDKTSSAEEY